MHVKSVQLSSSVITSIVQTYHKGSASAVLSLPKYCVEQFLSFFISQAYLNKNIYVNVLCGFFNPTKKSVSFAPYLATAISCLSPPPPPTSGDPPKIMPIPFSSPKTDLVQSMIFVHSYKPTLNTQPYVSLNSKNRLL